jgi:hypothetical protein
VELAFDAHPSFEQAADLVALARRGRGGNYPADR